VLGKPLESGKAGEAAQSLRRPLQVSRKRAIDRFAAARQEIRPDDLAYLEKPD
jgi:hypothetical protein